MGKKFTLKIYRGKPDHQYWEEFDLSRKPFYNITSALMDIQKEPVNNKGKRVTPVAWEQGCLEVVCGSCTILVNSRPVQGCVVLIDQVLEASGVNIITLAPLTTYPLIKDLVVDRSKMFENLKKIRAWVEVDDYLDRGWGPKIAPAVQEERYIMSTCISCGCCNEACPQTSLKSKFLGPAVISQVRLFNSHPSGKITAKERILPMMEEGGVNDCGNAQNCVQVCPKSIPLTESISMVGRKATKQALRTIFNPEDVAE